MIAKSGFTEKWIQLQPKLEGFIYQRVKNTAETKDILQDVYIKAFTKINSLKQPDKLSAWVYSIARNEVNAFFNEKKKAQVEIPEIDANDTEFISTCIEEYAAPFINALPQKYSEALQLVFIENLSQKELAKRLNISYSGAKSRVQRGKAKLKELIIACCTIEHDSYGNILNYTKKKDGFCPIPVSCS
jgi:RNA polymerase sigma-70 factor (ECF subfamily)